MKNLNNVDIRLTDALERQLLAEAIEAQQEYALDRALSQLFRKVAGFFKAPEGRMHHSVRTAH
ncbi:hypothetical protein [uncultured Castellaniella sp.]|jgi:hypothetical protein|uniref:hypothetical protein n=1 Tax=uncultured Castellaniella sp. TaxID=647907 RepID=UPI00262F2E46|nr:hypothetical protein [uncultured Castellaniella sp.]